MSTHVRSSILSFSRHVKKEFKIAQYIVIHGQDLVVVVVVAFFVQRKYIINECLQLRLCLGQYWYYQSDIASCPVPQ